MNYSDNQLEDTRKQTLADPQNNIDICDKKIKEVVNKVFPSELREVNKRLDQYKKAIESDVIARFQHFDFESLDIQMNKLENIDNTINTFVSGVKELNDNVKYEKNNIDKISKEWIEEINTVGRFNTSSIEVADQGIDNLKKKIKNIEKNKNSILNLTNILLVVVTGLTSFNTYYLFF